MAESVLLWSSYLMIVAVVILGLNGILSKSVAKGVGHSFFLIIRPLAPVIVYILLYMLVGYPQSLIKLTALELRLFDSAIQTVAAGFSVTVMLWLVMMLNSGMNRLNQKVSSLKWRVR